MFLVNLSLLPDGRYAQQVGKTQVAGMAGRNAQRLAETLSNQRFNYPLRWKGTLT
jgi:hypothetical protein